MMAFTFVKVAFLIVIMALPLANPLISVSLMLSMGARLPADSKRIQSKEAAIYSFIIMVISYYCGQLVMHLVGISIPGLRIAGGLIVMTLGFQMLFPSQSAINAPELESKKDELRERAVSKISFIPLTMPGFAGPGTIALLISIASSKGQFGAPSWVMMSAPILSFLILCLLLWVCLRSSEYIIQKLGQSGIDTISRIMGFLLVCMGVQFCINGVLEILKQYTAS